MTSHLRPFRLCSVVALLTCAMWGMHPDLWAQNLPANNLPEVANLREGQRTVSLPFGTWQPWRGEWRLKKGVYSQVTTESDCRTFAPTADWGDYVFEVKARKTGGREGFLVISRVEDEEDFYWWNIGGWGNTKHAVETRPRTPVRDPRPGVIQTNRWYDIKVVVKGASIRCYLDGELIHDIQDDTYRAGGVGLGSWCTQVEYRDARVTSLDGKDPRAALAAAEKLGKRQTDLFARKDTWPETMLSARAAWNAQKAGLALEDKQLGTDGVRLGPWRYSDPLPVDKGESLFASVFPPETDDAGPKQDPAKPFHWQNRMRRWQGPRREWNWTDGQILALRGEREAPAESVNFLSRTITSPEDRIVTAYLGADEGIVVWINGGQVFSREAERRLKPNQEKVVLPLKKGLNHLLIKLPHKRPGLRLYFSLSPIPGDRRPETIRSRIWSELREAFPVQTDRLQGRLLARGGKGDWLDRNDTEIERALIAEALGNGGTEPDGFRREFASLVSANAPVDDPRLLGLFERVCEARRASARKRCPPIAFLKRPANGRKGTNATMLGQRTKVGSSICTYDPAHPENGCKTVFDAPQGFVFDMSPSYDGRKIVFSFMDCSPEKKDSFHIWEISAGGTGLRQLTSGPYHDGSPVYLPDGRIVFSSTRVASFSMCQNFLACALYSMNGDGSNMRRIECSTLCDNTPFVMDDGSILFTRWEYQDKNIFAVQGLWTINPNGTRVQLFYGNTLDVPNSIYGAKQIPGTPRVVAVMAPHHGRPLGAICLIDRTFGLENPDALVNITPEIPYQPTLSVTWKGPFRWGPGDIQYPWAYSDPYPIAEDLFLVTYGGPVEGGPQRYRLYLLNDKGERFALYEDPATSCYCPVPLAPRPLPHAFPGAVPEAKGEGTFFVQDIYTWIDSNAPYYGTWDMSRPYTMGGRDAWARERSVRADWFVRFEVVYNASCISCHAENGGFESQQPNDLNAWINLTHPGFSRALNAHLRKEAGGMGLSKEKNGKAPPVFKDTNDPVYQAMLDAVQTGKESLDAKPRVDMPGATPIAQQRDFGKLY